jgi:SAM-dependent methyltransferase
MHQAILAKIAKFSVLGKSPLNAFLRLNRWAWRRLPSSLTGHWPISSYGNFLLTLIRLKANRSQNFGTLFFRNRPQLELIRRLSDKNSNGSPLRISVLACSKGAEVYSILWTIRSARPDLQVVMHAVDISKEVLEFAQRGVYSLKDPEFVNVPAFGQMTGEEIHEIFDIEGEQARIKAWIREGINWHDGDAGDPEMLKVLGSQDILVANNFLCHMDAPEAEICLRTIARLVKPGGYLFVSGIDLDVRTKVAKDLGWKPVQDLLEEIHEGDQYLRDDWPWEYWGLEPLNKRRHDWKIRYAAGFRLGMKEWSHLA